MWNEVHEVWVRTEGKEISIKQGTAESRPGELRQQYPRLWFINETVYAECKSPAATLPTLLLFKTTPICTLSGFLFSAAGGKMLLIVDIMKAVQEIII